MSYTYIENDKRVEKLDLQTCVEQYQVSQNEYLLRIILQKLSKTMNYIAYQKSNCPDKAEVFALCEDILLKCLNSYDPSYEVKFVTYYTNAVYNALKTLHQRTMAHVTLSLDYEYSTNEKEENSLSHFVGCEELGYDEVETKVLLEQLKKILKSKQRVEGQWQREYKVCKMLLTDPHKLTYAEIAREIQVTAAAVPIILERIKKKFIAADKNNLKVTL